MSISVSFSGGANEVGGSCATIEIDEKRVQIDMGIRLNVDQAEQLPDLDKIERLDAFLLTHAHTDHTGALSEFVRHWSCVKGYCTRATKPITQVLLKDNKKRLEDEEQEDEKALFTHEDIDAALEYIEFMEAVPWRTSNEICDGVTATWIPAGHILGAAMIYIEGERERILITGDVSVTDQKTIQGMSMSDLPYQPDVMVMESTYGKRQHKDRAEEERSLVQDVARVVQASGKVLIPAFAIGRSQEVILILMQAMQRGEIPKFPVWVDGLVRKVNDIYSRYRDELLPSLNHEAKCREDIFYSDVIKPVPRDCNRDEVSSWEPCCIVASSGMLNGGRSKGYFEHLANNPANLIAITGYQAEGTLGRRLQDLTEAAESKEQELKLDDEKSVSVKCQVKSYSLSAHADKDQLTSLVEKVQPRKLFLVHGDKEARDELSQAVKERCPSVAVKLPMNGKSYTVENFPGLNNGRTLAHDQVLLSVHSYLVARRLKYPISVRILAEVWFGTRATNGYKVDYFRFILSRPESKRFFKRVGKRYMYEVRI